MSSNYAGIDYGRGLSNVNHETGIRYGVISSHTVGQAWYDDAIADYGDPSCPECGNTVLDSDAVDIQDQEWFEGKDYACLGCKACYWSDSVFGDEPVGYSYEADGYKLTDCLDSDIFVLDSPYYTFAQFCSPCVPGAGNLDTFCPSGPKTYCLGHDWFENSKAPYPVYRVADNSEVLPKEN